MNELALIEENEIDAVAIFTGPSGVDKILKDIEGRVKSHVPDTSTATGRKEIASLAYKVSQSKTMLDNLGKNLVADWKTKAAVVDASRKTLRDTLDQLRDQAREPLTIWEKSEAERIAAEAAAEAAIIEAERLAAEYARDYAEALLENKLFDDRKKIELQLAEIARKEAELAEKIRLAKEEEDRKIAEAARIEEARRDAEFKAALEKEAEKTRIEREKKLVEEAKLTAEREAQEKFEAEQAKARQQALDAEKKRLADIKAAEEKAEAEKQAIIKAQQDKERKEAAEKAAEERRLAAEKAAEERRQADVEHRKQINNAVIKSIIDLGCEERLAVAIARAIGTGEIPHVSIKY